MAVTLKWASQAAAGLDNIEIYRSTTRFTALTMPAAPIATLAPTDTSYVDTAVVAGGNYYYGVVPVKAGIRNLASVQCVPHISNWGPAVDVPIFRGDQEAAYLGYCTNGVMPDAATLFGLMPDVTLGRGSWGGWYKYLHKGKIIFICNGVGITSATYDQLNALGLLFGTDVAADLPSWAAAGVNHKRVVTVGQYQYIVRMPRLSPRPFSEYINSFDQTVGSEFRDTIARASRLSIVVAAALPTAKSRIGDIATSYRFLSPHLASAVNTAMHVDTAHEQLVNSIPRTTATSTNFMLELIQ